MRYPASEKLEIIQLVEQSHLSVRRTLAQFGNPSSTFYRWHDRYRTDGPEALEDRRPKPNRIPDAIQAELLQLDTSNYRLWARRQDGGGGEAGGLETLVNDCVWGHDFRPPQACPGVRAGGGLVFLKVSARGAFLANYLGPAF